MSEAMKAWVRRRASRSDVRVQVVWHEDFTGPRYGELIDASADGAFIAVELPEELPVHCGAMIRLEAFVDHEGYAVEGAVRWIGPHPLTGALGFGLSFDPASAYVAEALAFRLCEGDRDSGIYSRQ